MGFLVSASYTSQPHIIPVGQICWQVLTICTALWFLRGTEILASPKMRSIVLLNPNSGDELCSSRTAQGLKTAFLLAVTWNKFALGERAEFFLITWVFSGNSLLGISQIPFLHLPCHSCLMDTVTCIAWKSPEELVWEIALATEVFTYPTIFVNFLLL